MDNTNILCPLVENNFGFFSTLLCIGFTLYNVIMHANHQLMALFTRSLLQTLS